VEEEGKHDPREETKQFYFNSDGNLVVRKVPYIHDPLAEFKFISTCDSMETQPGEEMFVINTHWLADWLEFSTRFQAQPGRITNQILCDEDGEIIKGLMPLFHYR